MIFRDKVPGINLPLIRLINYAIVDRERVVSVAIFRGRSWRSLSFITPLWNPIPQRDGVEKRRRIVAERRDGREKCRATRISREEDAEMSDDGKKGVMFQVSVDEEGKCRARSWQRGLLVGFVASFTSVLTLADDCDRFPHKPRSS